MDTNINKITSLDNQLVKKLVKLNNKKYREEYQEFIIEGYHLVNEAYDNNYLKEVYCIDEKDVTKYKNIKSYLVTSEIINKVSTTTSPQKIIGISKLLNNVDINQYLNNDNKIVILDEINDPGNLGTIIRTAAALGYNLIAMSSNTVDIYNSKVIRSTQGTIYHTNIYIGDIKELIINLKEHHYKVYGTSLHNAVNLNDVESSKRMAIIFGNEARGTKEELLSLTTKNIILPMENNVESLNVAVACGIIMYELKRGCK